MIKLIKNSPILNNEKGIAIGMVLTAVVILTTIIANFSFETNINKIKAYNIEDRAKAKLTAESGIQFALARLKLYKEAYNFLQNNTAAKDIVKQETLNSIWNFPFIYPIPVSKKMNNIQKEAIADFQENTLLEGQMQLTISNVSNKINLNMIRVSLIAETEKESQPDDESGEGSSEGSEEFNAETQLFNSLKNAFERESEDNELFQTQYQGIEPEDLVNEMKLNISDPEIIQDTAGADTSFSSADLEPKLAPFMSLSEIYTMPSWSDDIVNLIKNEFTVHGAVMIDLNKITDKLLKLLIPDITEDDIKEFYKYKDDPDNPKFFNTLEDFKNYIVSVGNLMSADDFDERFNNYLKQGLQFGPTPSLFKVISAATVGRATYTLTAFILLPAQPHKIKKENPEEDGEEGDGTTTGEDETSSGEEDSSSSTNSGDGEDGETDKPEEKTLLLEPRVVEIITT